MEVTGSTITALVPLAMRQRNGRARIVLPDDSRHEPDAASDHASAAVVRSIARAWDWRRRLEEGEVATFQDIADADKGTL